MGKMGGSMSDTRQRGGKGTTEPRSYAVARELKHQREYVRRSVRNRENCIPAMKRSAQNATSKPCCPRPESRARKASSVAPGKTTKTPPSKELNTREKRR